ncbi:hypothetical protein X551_04534 [Methylibium sp. T29]|nr:hypothetical protein X551_04534 [Methylibium sp. T29]EWS57359.1 hypothetical protein Y694_04625 [Methylibium sp. T29-B]
MHQVLRDEQLEPVVDDEQVLDRRAQRLPSRILQPLLLGGGERGAQVAIDQQPDARQQLRQAEPVHRREHRRVGQRRAVGPAGDGAVVHVRAPLVVAQRQQRGGDTLAQAVGQRGEQATLVEVVELALGDLLLVRAGRRVTHVEELARVLKRVPVGHHDRRTAGVEDLLVGLPQRPVVEVLDLLDVVGGLLVARRRLVAEARGQVREGVAQRLGVRGLDLNVHAVSSCCMHPPTQPACQPQASGFAPIRGITRAWTCSEHQIGSAGAASCAPNEQVIPSRYRGRRRRY